MCDKLIARINVYTVRRSTLLVSFVRKEFSFVLSLSLIIALSCILYYCLLQQVLSVNLSFIHLSFKCYFDYQSFTKRLVFSTKEVWNNTSKLLLITLNTVIIQTSCQHPRQTPHRLPVKLPNLIFTHSANKMCS